MTLYDSYLGLLEYNNPFFETNYKFFVAIPKYPDPSIAKLFIQLHPSIRSRVLFRPISRWVGTPDRLDGVKDAFDQWLWILNPWGQIAWHFRSEDNFPMTNPMGRTYYHLYTKYCSTYGCFQK